MKTAVITGIRGQDSSYLAELLLEKGYTVVGVARRIGGNENDENIRHIKNQMVMEQGDLTDFGSMARIVKEYKPDEFYNLGAQSFVGSSWSEPVSTCQINFIGPCNCLEAIRLFNPATKFFQASTSEVYGDVISDSQNEQTAARPRSPYAASKYGAESLVKVFRESYNLFACYARSFNHESPRRPKQFVTRKITSGIANMVRSIPNNKSGKVEDLLKQCVLEKRIEPIRLGNLDASRDWSHAKDIVRGIHQMMQLDSPEDFVFASGETRSIRNFLDTAFGIVGVEDWSDLVVVDPKFFRPAEVAILKGDCSKAIEKLGWKPEISFNELVVEMLERDLDGK